VVAVLEQEVIQTAIMVVQVVAQGVVRLVVEKLVKDSLAVRLRTGVLVVVVLVKQVAQMAQLLAAMAFRQASQALPPFVLVAAQEQDKMRLRFLVVMAVAVLVVKIVLVRLVVPTLAAVAVAVRLMVLPTTVAQVAQASSSLGRCE